MLQESDRSFAPGLPEENPLDLILRRSLAVNFTAVVDGLLQGGIVVFRRKRSGGLNEYDVVGIIEDGFFPRGTGGIDRAE